MFWTSSQTSVEAWKGEAIKWEGQCYFESWTGHNSVTVK